MSIVWEYLVLKSCLICSYQESESESEEEFESVPTDPLVFSREEFETGESLRSPGTAPQSYLSS